MSEKVVEKLSPEFVAELQQMPNLRSQFPHRFFGGGAINGLSIICCSCSTEVSDDNIHGHIEAIAGGESASIRAFAICYKCQIISPLEARYDQSGAALIKNSNGTWSKSTWCEEKQQQSAGGIKSFLWQHWHQVMPPTIAVIVVAAWIIGHAQ